MQLTADVAKRICARLYALIGAAAISLVLSGCAPEMAPVQTPLSRAPLNLCNASPAPPPKDLASNPNYVEFSVDVVDSSGAPFNGLAQSDFVAAENGQPISIAYFRADRDRPPVSIGILVDKSGSMVSKLPVVYSAVELLLSKIGACDEVYIYAFGMDPILVEDFTTDHVAAGRRLRLVGAWGQTPFFDGVRLGVAHLDAGHYPRSVVVIFTDDTPSIFSSSLDNASKNTSRDDIVNSALNSHKRFIVVGVGRPDASKLPSIGIAIAPWSVGNSSEGVGTDDLQKFATSLGGEFYLIAAEPDKSAPKITARPRDARSPGLFNPKYTPLAADPAQLQQFATSVAAQIDSHYTIGVISSGGPASDANQVTIRLANRPSARTMLHQIKRTAAAP